MYKTDKKGTAILWDFVVVIMTIILLVVIFLIFMNACSKTPEQSPSNEEFLNYRTVFAINDKLNFFLEMPVSEVIDKKIIETESLNQRDIENYIKNDYSMKDIMMNSHPSILTLENSLFKKYFYYQFNPYFNRYKRYHFDALFYNPNHLGFFRNSNTITFKNRLHVNLGRETPNRYSLSFLYPAFGRTGSTFTNSKIHDRFFVFLGSAYD